MSKYYHSLFFTALYSIDFETAKTIEKLVLAFEKSGVSYWQLIGYKYIAPLKEKYENGTLKSNNAWVNQLLCAALDQENENNLEIITGVNHYSSDQKNYHFDNNFVEKAVLQCFESGMSEYDKDYLMQLTLKDKDGDEIPISPHNKWNIGIVNPWPGDMSAEAEVLSRMNAAAEEAGFTLTMLSNFGHILDAKTQKQTEEFISSKELDFVISTHYDTFKSIDSFYYHTLWNPPEIPLNLFAYAGNVTDNYLMNEDYLIYDDGGMRDHIKCILMNCERNIENSSSLTASFPESKIMKPCLDNPKMFYCGMNWERVVHNTNRHEGLFKLLDKTGKVKFFGPDCVKAWGGIRPWEGYKCYQYPIPFDGFSILDEINKCGICLVLSSDIHRKAGAATNRTYEACAAGAVIITDDNPFMMKYFKDAALFIQYNKNDPKDTFRQIMEKYTWIVENKEEAMKLAQRAQNIFLDKFALNKQLKELVKKHPSRVEQVKKDLYAKNDSDTVLVTMVLNTLEKKQAYSFLESFFKNIKNQYYRSIQPVVLVDERIEAYVKEVCRRELCTCDIVSLALFDFKESRVMTDAQALEVVYRKFPHKYYINMRAEELWFRDHITTLVRCLEDSDAYAAYSGRLFEDTLGYRRTDMYKKITSSTLFYQACPDWMPVPGQVLFKAECHELMAKHMLRFIDGYEHNAMLSILFFIEDKTIVFSKRMSFSYVDGKVDRRASVIPEIMQIRLMQDLVKYALPEQTLATTGASITELKNALVYIPIKLLILIRMQRILLRFLPTSSKMFKEVEKKLNKNIAKFLS